MGVHLYLQVTSMASFSPLIDNLIESLRCLPGVGPRSAQRMALHLLERDRERAQRLSQAISTACDKVGHCESCRTLCETTHCHICNNPKRDASSLCIVETPADILAIEQTGSFRGKYFVLLGHLSPLDGIGPSDIGIDKLQQRLKTGGITEVILATNPTVEGEATAHYIAEITKAQQIQTTRIAHGVPLGSELELIDGGTLAHAFAGRELV